MPPIRARFLPVGWQSQTDSNDFDKQEKSIPSCKNLLQLLYPDNVDLKQLQLQGRALPKSTSTKFTTHGSTWMLSTDEQFPEWSSMKASILMNNWAAPKTDPTAGCAVCMEVISSSPSPSWGESRRSFHMLLSTAYAALQKHLLIGKKYLIIWSMQNIQYIRVTICIAGGQWRLVTEWHGICRN